LPVSLILNAMRGGGVNMGSSKRYQRVELNASEVTTR